MIKLPKKKPSKDQSIPTQALKNKPQKANTNHISKSIKVVTFYEILKGISAFIASFALWTWHSNLLQLVKSASTAWTVRFGTLFDVQIEALIRAATQTSENWFLFSCLISVYAVFRFIEAYGLWTDKAWAYWLGVLGYGLLIPVELYFLIVKPFDWFKLLILLLNIFVVYVVFKQMRKKGLI